MREKINRREFLKKGSSAVIGAGFAPVLGTYSGISETAAAKVVEVKHPEVIQKYRLIDEKIAREMLRQGLKRLTGSDDPWRHFVKPEERIGLKINTLGRPILFTHHGLIRAVVEELKEYGVKENHILIWDRFERHMEDCGFEFNTSGKSVRCYGTIALKNETDRLDRETAYASDCDNPDKREDSGTKSFFSGIFTQECDKIINMPVLKDHRLSGITFCLKNLAFGLCENNSRFHGSGHIGPYIADFCALPSVREKTVLHIGDVLEACYDQGPRPRQLRALFSPRKIWLGRDPVAMDALGFQAIETERRYKALPSLEEENRPIDHISRAAKKGIGVGDLRRIKVEKILLG